MTTTELSASAIETAPASSSKSGGAYLLIGPAVVWMTLFLVVPMAMIVYVSFWTQTTFKIESTLTLASWRTFFASDTYLSSLWTTIRIWLTVLAATFFVGYPTALFVGLFVKNKTLQTALLVLCVIPFWTSFLIRVVAWRPMLGKEGAINILLMKAGIIHQPIEALLFTELSVVIGMTQIYVVFMVGPIAFMLGRIDPNILEAARDLGAGFWRVLRKIIFPLSLPGVVVGAIFVSVMVLGEFATSAALSGRKVNLLGNIIVTQVGSLKWALASVVGVILTIIMGDCDRGPPPGRRPEEGALRAMESRLLKPMLAVYVGLFLLFLYGPFIVLGILSFQKGPEGGPQFPIEEWSLFWYRHILGLAPPSRVSPLPIGISLVRSLTLAFMTMVTSTVLGVMAAQAFRRNFRGRSLVFYLIVLGMIVPGVLVGLGSALVATTTGIERHWYTTAFATHVVYTLPFCFLVMLAIFNRFDSSVEEAAWSLGVSPTTTFRKITFPLIFPGVLSAMLFAFTLSYDEFSRTLFSSGREQTLPLAIYSTFAVEIHPNVFAFGVLTTLFSFALLSVYAILMSLSVRRARRMAIQEAV